MRSMQAMQAMKAMKVVNMENAAKLANAKLTSGYYAYAFSTLLFS